MLRKTFNSKSARELAKKHKLKLIDIKTHRVDNKVTVNNVKDSIKRKPIKLKSKPIKLKSKPIKPKSKPIKPKSKPKPRLPIRQMNNVTLIIKPIVVKGDQKLSLNMNNLILLKKWWEERLPWGSAPVINQTVSLFEKTPGDILLKLNFSITELDTFEKLLAIDNASNPDNTKNYPISIINERIVSINKDVTNGGSQVYVRGEIERENVSLTQ
jgi:hypothetical protein